MTRNEIIRMARRVGMAGMLTDIVTTLDELQRFAALVEVEVCKRHEARIADLEAQLKDVGAGGGTAFKRGPKH